MHLPSVTSMMLGMLSQNRRARVIAVANQKGGVGKTTTTINLGAAMAESDKRVLIVDLDPQANATTGLGISSRGLQSSVYEVMLQQTTVTEVVCATEVPNLEVVPSSLALAGAEIELVTAFSREHRLDRALETVADDYDIILIDCPPALGLLTINALVAAGEVLVPIQCEYFAMEGLTQMIEVIKRVMATKDNQLEFGGILLTMYDDSLELTREVDAEVRDFFGEIVFDSVVPRDVAVSESPSHGKSVLSYAPRSRGARAYVELCLEILEA